MESERIILFFVGFASVPISTLSSLTMTLDDTNPPLANFGFGQQQKVKQNFAALDEKDFPRVVNFSVEASSLNFTLTYYMQIKGFSRM